VSNKLAEDRGDMDIFSELNSLGEFGTESMLDELVL
jgi:hypothetical protein